jgi:hypothetical protein
VLKYLESLVKLLLGRSHPEIAKIVAYLVAPAVVLSLAALSADSHGLGLDLIGPITISELRSEIMVDGTTHSRPGVAVIVEPTSAELRVPIVGPSGGIWSSLDESTLKANRDRLHLDGGGVVSRTPLLGVNGPVAIVIDGRLGSEIQTVGGTDPINNWMLPARRSVSILSSVLLAWVFAFGMAFSAAIPPGLRPDQNGRREVRT